MTMETSKKKPRGFAAMDPARHRALASKGGKTSRSEGGPGHCWTREEASAAGRKGAAARAAVPAPRTAAGHRSARKPYAPKLTAAQVREVRRLLAEGLSYRAVAQRLGCSKDRVGAIARGASYRHVEAA